MIRKVALHKLRNDAHFQLHSAFIELVNKTEVLSLKLRPLFDKYLLVYNRMDEALKKINKSILTEQIQAADKARDEVWYGLVEASAAALRHFNPNIRTSAKKLKIVFDTYGNVARKPFNEQTSAVYNILQDLEGKYAPDVANVGVGDWVSELKILNNAFNTLMNERHDEVAARTAVVLKEARGEANELYHAMIHCVEAFILLEGFDDYSVFAKTWNSVLSKFKTRKSNKDGSSSTSEEEEDEMDDLEDIGGSELTENTP